MQYEHIGVTHTLLTPEQLHDYQKECVLHQLYYADSMLWLQMGLGKTIVTLTAIVDRMRAGQVKKTLIFGPLRVIQSVWTREARKWSHTRHLRFSIVHGQKEKRTRALFADADIFLCNYEAMNWLAQELDHYFLSQGYALPFQMVVYDEVSKLKNSTTKRMGGGKREKIDNRGDTHIQKLVGWRKMIDEFQFRVGLTGTPASNGYIDLHGQYLAVDGGERLGEYVTHYRDSYFMNADRQGWKYEPTALGKQWIEHKISDITKKMDARDYLDMPDVKVVNIMVTMPDSVREVYRDLEKKLFAQLDSGTEIELFNKASLSNKCLQLCNGNIYTVAGAFEMQHDAKLDALESVLEEAGGNPVLCSYTFVADAQRIMERFKKYKPVNLNDTKSSATGKVIDRWNAGQIKLLIGHPQTMGHGIDGLQQRGHILTWFGLPWSLEHYTQMNARLDRQGQTNVVSIIRILCNDSIDLAVADALQRKQDDEDGLKAAIDRYRKGYTTNELKMNFY